MSKLTREFIAEDHRAYNFKIGHHVASSLTGFIAGVVFATIIWGVVILVLIYVPRA